MMVFDGGKLKAKEMVNERRARLSSDFLKISHLLLIAADMV